MASGGCGGSGESPSDSFWATFDAPEGDYADGVGPLTRLVAESDAIVFGHLLSVRAGGTAGAVGDKVLYAAATIAATRLLKVPVGYSASEPRLELRLEVLQSDESVASFDGSDPPALYFLRIKRDIPHAVGEWGATVFRPLGNVLGVIVERDGKVATAVESHGLVKLPAVNLDELEREVAVIQRAHPR